MAHFFKKKTPNEVSNEFVATKRVCFGLRGFSVRHSTCHFTLPKNWLNFKTQRERERGREREKGKKVRNCISFSTSKKDEAKRGCLMTDSENDDHTKM